MENMLNMLAGLVPPEELEKMTQIMALLTPENIKTTLINIEKTRKNTEKILKELEEIRRCINEKT